MRQEAEGIIKYDQSGFRFIDPLPKQEYAVVETYRKMLNDMNLIGVYENGLGYGNISRRKNYLRLKRTKRPQFIITGTQTGHLKDLTGEHYTRVIDFDIQEFSVTAQGSVRASSETVTHASIYEMNAFIGAVIHIHNKAVWNYMIAEGYPSTGKWIPYGTYEMAVSVKECIGDATQGLIVMKGHEEGVIAYGPNLSTTIHLIENIYKKALGRRAPYAP